MESKLNLWNIHDWLDERGIDHFYTLEDELSLFGGIRFRAPETDTDSFAVVYDVTDNNQYRSVLSFKNGRIYFRFLNAGEAMNLLNEMLFKYSDWRMQLTNATLTHGSLDQLLTASASLFRLPMIILRNTKIVARTNDRDIPSDSDLGRLFCDPSFIHSCCAALKGAKGSDGILLFESEYFGHLIMKRIPFHEDYVLVLAKAGIREATQADLVLFKQVCSAVSSDLKNREDSVTPPEHPAKIMDNTGWHQDDSYQVFCIQFKDPDLQCYPDMLRPMLSDRFPDCSTLVRDDRLFLFVNTSRCGCIPDESAFKKLTIYDLCYIGQSNLHSGISDLSPLADQAKEALLIARQTGKTFMSAQDISTLAVLERFHSDSSLQALVHPAVRLLNEIDMEGRAGFACLSTLEAYLTCGANNSAAARKLQLHRNSFINRIDRIKEMTGLTLDDPKELEALLLSIMILDRDPSGSGK